MYCTQMSHKHCPVSFPTMCSLPPPPGTKKAPKIYGLAVHPTQPHVVAAATNTGVAVLALAALPQPLPVVPLPLASPTQALYDDGAAGLGSAFGGGGGGAGGGSGGCTYVAAMGSAVLCVTAATLPGAELADLPANQVMGKLTVRRGPAGVRR